mmetsp:Transcript_30494/g.29899  ORF Transcript_30494/g.29899 Transcript_30494/m.29899 type:complete len:90 (+) Transcript_30494:1407-1676(+)
MSQMRNSSDLSLKAQSLFQNSEILKAQIQFDREKRLKEKQELFWKYNKPHFGPEQTSTQSKKLHLHNKIKQELMSQSLQEQIAEKQISI